MTRLFFQYLAIYNNDILPKVGSQLCQITNKPLKYCQIPKFLLNCRNFVKSGPTSDNGLSNIWQKLNVFSEENVAKWVFMDELPGKSFQQRLS